MKFKKILLVGFLLLFFFLDVVLNLTFKGGHGNPAMKYDVIPISHRLANDLSDYEAVEQLDMKIADFLIKRKIHGASVAISHQGKLIYAKGFGYSNYELNESVEPKHLFRIASVSKLITAIAIMKLHEDKVLSIEDHVFGKNGLLNDSIYQPNDENYFDITIHHLLVHTAGWSRRRGDPVFMPLTVANTLNIDPPVDAKDVIQYALLKPLDYEPGEKYSYSNLGFIILGQIVEEVTGLSYEDYVRFEILEPLGIYDMHIGNNFYEERFKNEVKYYESGNSGPVYAFDGSGNVVPQAYGGNNIQLLGPAGGWVASAVELMKLMVAVDGFPGQPDLLKKETINLMTDRNINGNSLIGWKGSDGRGNWWRTGTLSGTAALILRQRNNINWIVLLNTTTKNRDRIHSEISRLMFESVHTIDEWPKTNLFDYFEPEILQAENISFGATRFN
jgi:CubicO group peptidase (beta-lactamase class C family)